VNPLENHDICVEGNMDNISETIPNNISKTSGIIETIFISACYSPKEICMYTSLFKEFCDFFAWSYKEILGIDPRIVEHEICTYKNDNIVLKKLRPTNPRKATIIKDEVEKILKAIFIYPVPIIEWVSNPILVDKNKGTISICMDFHDMNKACPSDKFPTYLIDQIIDECVLSEIFSIVDGFSRYNKIQI
jgi:hypothetical protein